MLGDTLLKIEDEVNMDLAKDAAYKTSWLIQLHDILLMPEAMRKAREGRNLLNGYFEFDSKKLMPHSKDVFTIDCIEIVYDKTKSLGKIWQMCLIASTDYNVEMLFRFQSLLYRGFFGTGTVNTVYVLYGDNLGYRDDKKLKTIGKSEYANLTADQLERAPDLSKILIKRFLLWRE